jgi:hypothetical protein
MKIMKRTLIASLFACVLLTGCVKTVTRTQLDAAIQAHAHETVTWVSYAGSQDGFHYLHHSYTLGSDAYRISESELQIDNPFPLTKDKEKWRPLKKHWEAWGGNLITEDSQHQPAPYFK